MSFGQTDADSTHCGKQWCGNGTGGQADRQASKQASSGWGKKIILSRMAASL